MILGTGIDVVDLASFAQQLAEPGTAFSRVFTARERRQARARALAHAAPGSARSGEAEHLAVRWAAKEAFVKAWSAALWGSPPVLADMAWHEVEVVSDAWHRPGLAVHGRVAEELAASLGQVRLHLSLSHDGPVAMASVIIEAWPAGTEGQPGGMEGQPGEAEAWRGDAGTNERAGDEERAGLVGEVDPGNAVFGGLAGPGSGVQASFVGQVGPAHQAGLADETGPVGHSDVGPVGTRQADSADTRQAGPAGAAAPGTGTTAPGSRLAAPGSDAGPGGLAGPGSDVQAGPVGPNNPAGPGRHVQTRRNNAAYFRLDTPAALSDTSSSEASNMRLRPRRDPSLHGRIAVSYSELNLRTS